VRDLSSRRAPTLYITPPCNQVRDLLTPRLESAAKSLDIRVTPTGSEVVGLTQFEVHTPAEVQDLMLRGNASRYEAHFVFFFLFFFFFGG
jgi:hypothetical protein